MKAKLKFILTFIVEEDSVNWEDGETGVSPQTVEELAETVKNYIECEDLSYLTDDEPDSLTMEIIRE